MNSLKLPSSGTYLLLVICLLLFAADLWCQDPGTDRARITAEIKAGLSSLTSGKSTYDGKHLEVSYTTPEAFEEDCEIVGNIDRKHIEFRPVRISGKRVGEDIQKGFAGNTTGLIFLKPHFRGEVTVEVEILYQWIERGSHLMVLLHGSEEGYWGSDFGARAVLNRKGKKLRIEKSKFQEFNKDPTKWFDRTAWHKQKLVFSPSEEKLTTFLDGMNTSELAVKKAPAAGQVGFLWNKVKFSVCSVKIRGELDRQWAARELKIDTGSGK